LTGGIKAEIVGITVERERQGEILASFLIKQLRFGKRVKKFLNLRQISVFAIFAKMSCN
jgi:hypothetical protein